MILNQFGLVNKVAVVVGGTGGLGAAMARGLAEAGADVLATSRNIDKVNDITSKIESLGRKTTAIATDATNEDEVRRLTENCLDFYGRVDILINAAGINIRKNIIEMTYDDWSAVIRTNLDSVFLCAKYFARSMIKKRYGKIINIGSMNSVIASSELCAYAASKGGVVQLSKALAVELSQYNINVNVVLPGYFDTELTEPVTRNKVTLRRIQARTPMGRIGATEEIIGAAIFLASDASQFITGETLAVDGGFLSFGVDFNTNTTAETE